MYRDDQCAVCGESLPPDHLYCREHAATVDDRLHQVGELLGRVAADLPRLAELLDQIAQETYDWLAEAHDPDADWPPAPAVALRVAPEDVDVDVDTEPGYVSVAVRAPLPALLASVAAALGTPAAAAFSAACADARGANATH